VRHAAKDDADAEPRSPPAWSMSHSMLSITPLFAVYDVPFELGQVGLLVVGGFGVGVGVELDAEVELELEVVCLFRIAPHTSCL